MATLDLSLFKQDIDDLLNEFVGNESKTLTDMKRIWLSRKFTFIYEASPKTNLAFFMQSLYSHTLGHMVSGSSLSERLGALYCLYCLYETQPHKPPFRIYLSLRELKILKSLLVEAKLNDTKVGHAVVKRMLERNAFLFGCVDLAGTLVNERVNEINELLSARMQVACDKLLSNTQVQEYLHMDLGKELDLKGLQKVAAEYAKAKKSAIKEASAVVGTEDIDHIDQTNELIGDKVEKISEEWSAQREQFYKKTGILPKDDFEAGNFDEELEHLLTQN